MIIDLNREDPPSLEGFDVCVCGAGPAGITVARQLAAKNKRVLLLEGGGYFYTDESQDLYDADSTGREAWVNRARQRFFGGSSNHWAGRCRPFEALDFTRETPTDLPGWPIGMDEIAPYLEPALKILDVDSDAPFTTTRNPDVSSRFVADVDERSPPTRFNSKYKDELESSEDITVLLNANATGMRLRTGSDSVERVVFKTYDDETYSAEAGTFVVAMGAVENARFLLNCTEDVSVGLGNEQGMVGAGFMEHLNVPFGEFVAKGNPDDFRMSVFTSDAFIESGESIGRSNVSMAAMTEIKSYGRTAAIKTFFKKVACGLNIADELSFITEIQCPGTGVIASLTEQFPARSSFVGLSDRVDRFGRRQARLHWVLSPEDRSSIRQIGVQLGKDFVDGGFGVIKLDPGVLDPQLPLGVSKHAHHMGTTRMSDDPKDGVVDRNCKVFGVQNLYIAGSSVFSTGAACNPTMPLLQFALRLADHIGESSAG